MKIFQNEDFRKFSENLIFESVTKVIKIIQNLQKTSWEKRKNSTNGNEEIQSNINKPDNFPKFSNYLKQNFLSRYLSKRVNS